MTKLLTASMMTLMILGLPSMALADDDHGHGGNSHHGAPEPLTVAGLALGAGGIAVARWVSKRKGNRKPE